MLDGKFDDNVVVQIKSGPMDFQVREPISPLLAGGPTKTNVMMEVQATQEYTGQQIHAVSLTAQWSSYLSFDTLAHGPVSPKAPRSSPSAPPKNVAFVESGLWVSRAARAREPRAREKDPVAAAKKG